MSFRMHALSPEQFAGLHRLSDDELRKMQAVRKTADARPGYPCRVSLQDAEIGETVILLNYMHQSADSPFRATHAIYVREDAPEASPDIGAVPEMFEGRTISIRAFDHAHFIIHADIAEGADLAQSITAILDRPDVAYLHLHNARLGCYLARVTRA